MNADGIIFSADEMKDLDPGRGPFWTPMLDQIAVLESLLPGYLRIHPPEDDKAIENVFDYGRQYWGVIKNGQRLIYVNAFCRPARFQWNKWLVEVADGGSCYFQAYFDPLKKEFVNFRYNGQA